MIRGEAAKYKERANEKAKKSRRRVRVYGRCLTKDEGQREIAEDKRRQEEQEQRGLDWAKKRADADTGADALRESGGIFSGSVRAMQRPRLKLLYASLGLLHDEHGKKKGYVTNTEMVDNIIKWLTAHPDLRTCSEYAQLKLGKRRVLGDLSNSSLTDQGIPFASQDQSSSSSLASSSQIPLQFVSENQLDWPAGETQTSQVQGSCSPVPPTPGDVKGE